MSLYPDKNNYTFEPFDPEDPNKAFRDLAKLKKYLVSPEQQKGGSPIISSNGSINSNKSSKKLMFLFAFLCGSSVSAKRNICVFRYSMYSSKSAFKASAQPYTSSQRSKNACCGEVWFFFVF